MAAYAPAPEGMKTGASGGILILSPERYRPVCLWCLEPENEDGQGALRNW